MRSRKIANTLSRKRRRRRFMKKRKLLTKIAACATALVLGLSGMGASYAATQPDNSVPHNVYPKPSVYSESGPLFTATNFHIFAEDAASITSHCNGNIATKFLKQGSNSGSNKLYDSQRPEYNYIRKFQDGSVVRFGPETKVVFGKETDVYLRQGAEIYIDMFDAAGNESSIQKMDISSDRVFTESGTEDKSRFINFNDEFRKLSILSYNLAKEPSTAVVSGNEIDMDGLTGTNYVNVTPNDLKGGSAFVIDNTSFRTGQAIVINVDLGTLTNYTVPFTQVLLKDTSGTSFGSGEDKGDPRNGGYTGYGNVLWNFYGRDESGAITTYTGEIMTCSEFKGTILAPDAVIRTAASNQDGNFIGREVHLGGGETHRWDFGGTLKSYNYNSSFASLNAKATIQGTDTGVEGVEIYVYLKDEETGTTTGDPVAKIITGADGTTTTVGSIPVGNDYVGVVKQVPYGYELVNENDIVKITAEDTVYTLKYELTEIANAPAPTTGYIKVVVKDADTGKYIKDVTVTVTDNNGVVTSLTTDEFGTTKTGTMPIGTVCDVVIGNLPAGYEVPVGKQQPVSDKNPDEVVFVVSKKEDTTPKGSIQVVVVEKDTNRAIEGVEVKITEDASSHIVKEYTVVTDKYGETDVVSGLGVGTVYKTEIISIPEGYKLYSSTGIDNESKLTLPDTNTYVVTYILEQEIGTGSLISKVVNEDGEAVSGVTIEVRNEAGELVKTYVTNDKGLTDEYAGLPEGKKYTATITAVPEGYVVSNETKSATIEEGKVSQLNFVIEKEPEPTGDLIVTIKDVTDPDNKKPIEGAVIVVENSDGDEVKRVTTDSAGKFRIDDLPVGDYIVITESIPSSYDPSLKPGSVTTTVVANQETQVDLTVPGTPVVSDKGNLEITIKDEDTNEPIPNAKVIIVDKSTGEVVKDNLTTDKDGYVLVEDLPVDTYIIEVTEVPGGYNPPENEEATVVAGSTVKKELVVDLEVGSVEVVITDKNDPTKPIPGATVEIKDEDGNVVKTVITGTDGKTPVVEDLKIGETYTAHVTDVPGGYTAPDDKSVKIEDEKTKNVELEVGKSTTPTTPEEGSVQVVITDKNDPTKPIPGATVQILDKDKNVVATVVTGTDGKTPVVDNLKVGESYTAHVTDVKDGYTAPDDKTVRIETTETTNVKLEVEKSNSSETPSTPEPEKGKIDVIITDKNTGDPIPGATVVIKNPDGSIKETVTTDENGRTPVIEDLNVGESYTIVTTKVPEGYVAPEPTTQKITGTDKVTVPLETGRDSGVTSSTGSLYVIITDKNTGDPIPGATVEISNSAGEVVKTVITDATGAFTVTNLKPDTYTVKTTKVPAGYTAPDTQSAAVKTNARTDVHLYVAKGATNTTDTPATDTVVQTGDESNVKGVSMLAFMAMIGIVVVSIMRKREEI